MRILKNYTIPFTQLEPLKSIFVFAHQYNTFDKRNLLKNPNPAFVHEMKDMKLRDCIRAKWARDFYTTI